MPSAPAGYWKQASLKIAFFRIYKPKNNVLFQNLSDRSCTCEGWLRETLGNQRL